MTAQTTSMPNVVLDKWQKLSVWSILHFIFDNIVNLGRFAIYVVPALAINFSHVMAYKHYSIPAIFMLLLLTVLSGVARYWFFRYRLTNEQVEIQQGVLKRSLQNIPFERIQNVKQDQPFYFRLHQRTNMTLDTAGSAKEEGQIVALDAGVAVQLRTFILAHKGQQKTTTATTTELDHEPVLEHEVLLNRRSLKDLVLHGITNNRVWILIGAAAPFYESVGRHALNWIELNTGWIGQSIRNDTYVWWQASLFLLGVTILVMTLLTLLSVLGSIVIFYDYRLSRTQSRYIRRSGLLNKQEVSLKLSRLQVVKSAQDWLDILLGRSNLYLEQNLTGPQQHNELSSTNKLIVPSVTVDEVKALASDAMPNSKLIDGKYRPISHAFVTHIVFIRLLPLALLASSMFLLVEQYRGVALSLALLIITSAAATLRWKRWGYAYDGHYLYIRKGLLGKEFTCFEVTKCQQVSLHQSVFMRKRGVGSVKFVLASGRYHIPYIDFSVANQLVDETLLTVEREQRSWM